MLRQLANEPVTSLLRQEAARKARDATAFLKDLEDQAIVADSVAKSALRERQESSDELARLQGVNRKLIAGDSRLTSSQLAKEWTQTSIRTQQREPAANTQRFLQMPRGYQQLVQQRVTLDESNSRRNLNPKLLAILPW